MTVEQVDQALLRLVARQRARMAQWAIASLKEQSKAGLARHDEAGRRLEDIEPEPGREAAAEEGFRA